MVEEKENQSTSSQSTSRVQPQASSPSNTQTESTQEYVLTARRFVQYVDGKSGKVAKTYKRGQRVSLDPDVARTLLRQPRPSVRELTDEEKKGS